MRVWEGDSSFGAKLNRKMGWRKTVKPTNNTHGVDYIFRFTKRWRLTHFSFQRLSSPQFCNLIGIFLILWFFALSGITWFRMFQAESPFFFMMGINSGWLLFENVAHLEPYHERMFRIAGNKENDNVEAQHSAYYGFISMDCTRVFHIL